MKSYSEIKVVETFAERAGTVLELQQKIWYRII